jgi:hypothetical protein
MNRPITLTGLLATALAASLMPDSALAARALRLEPERVELMLGARRQFRAQGVRRGAEVRWRVVSGVGSISDDGIYTAPARAETPATVVVQAEAEGVAAGEARVLIAAVRVRARSDHETLQLGEACRLRAEVKGAEDDRVEWSVEGDRREGEVSDAGLYTTPDRHPTPATVAVRATSMADPSKSAVVTLRLSPVSLEVRPRETRVRMGESRRFEATVRGARRADVRWSVVGEGRGSISSSGLYTPPESIGTPTVVTVEAQCEADPTKVAQARVTISEVGISITPVGVPRGRQGSGPRVSATVYRVVRLSLPLDPLDSLVRFPLFQGRSGRIYVPVGGAYQFQAKVDGADTDIRWGLEGGRGHGSISDDGLYRAPERMLTPQVVRVVAQSAADPGRRAVATLHIPPVYLEGGDRRVSVPLGGAVRLQAQVRNAENDRIHWEVDGGDRRGAVSEAGLFRPAEPLTTPTTVLVRAVSDADDTKSLAFEVAIPEVSVRLSPGEATVRAGSTLRLQAEVRGAQNPAVRWRLEPALGTISPSGRYTPPDDLRHEADVEITATSAADPTKSARAVVRVLPHR